MAKAPKSEKSPVESSKDKDLSFEKALDSLEELVEKMESGTLSLEELMDSYEQGSKLAKVCENYLSRAEVRITELEQSKVEQTKSTSD